MQALVQSGSARVVVVTGASAGVGRAIVHRFARAGWRIGLIARDAAALAAGTSSTRTAPRSIGRPRRHGGHRRNWRSHDGDHMMAIR